MLDAVYTFYGGRGYESLQNRTETTNNNKTARHMGARQPHKQIKASRDRKLPPLTQHSGCHKGDSLPAAESSKGASKEAGKQLCGCWASRGTSYLCNERTWKLLNSSLQRKRLGGGLQQPLFTGKLSGKGVGERAWEWAKCDTLGSREKGSCSQE